MNDYVPGVIAELQRAQAKFPPFNSAHEGFAVLLEEVEELKQEVFWGKSKDAGTNAREAGERMRAEAVQVAAMALRFIKDVCDR